MHDFLCSLMVLPYTVYEFEEFESSLEENYIAYPIILDRMILRFFSENILDISAPLRKLQKIAINKKERKMNFENFI